MQIPEHRTARVLEDNGAVAARVKPLIVRPTEFLKLDIGDWVIMPNHAHAILQPIDGHELEESLPYRVAGDGTVDISTFQARMKLSPLVVAVKSGNTDAVAKELQKLEANVEPEPRAADSLLIITGSGETKTLRDCRRRVSFFERSI